MQIYLQFIYVHINKLFSSSMESKVYKNVRYLIDSVKLMISLFVITDLFLVLKCFLMSIFVLILSD